MNLQHVRDDFSLLLPDDTLQEFSPVYHLRKRPKDIAPLFIVRAGLDRAWLNASIDQFVMDALTGNAMIDVMTHPDGHHAFDVQDDDARSREIIARTLEFIRVRLSGP